MNEWQVAAIALAAALVPCAWMCARRGFAAGVLAVQLSGMISAIALLVIAEGEGRQPFADLALVLAVTSFAGSLVFLRFLERQR